MAEEEKEDTKTMLYKHPGPHKIHGDKFDHTVVKASQVDDACEAGWCKTTTEALKKSRAAAKEKDPELKRGPGRPKKEG